MQLMADTLASNPKKPGELRVEAQQMWGVSSEVLTPETGNVEQPQEKMRRYQQAYRKHMRGLGYDVELHASERNTSSHTREEWAALKERERTADDGLASTSAQDDKNIENIRKLISMKEHETVRTEANDRRTVKLDAELAKLPKLRTRARSEVYSEGLDLAEQEIADAHLAAAQAREEAESAAADARAESARLRALREAVERDLAEAGPPPQSPGYDDMRADFLREQPAQMTRFLKKIPLKDGRTMFDKFEDSARAEHARLQRRGDPVPSYEMWRDRTVAAQSRHKREGKL